MRSGGRAVLLSVLGSPALVEHHGEWDSLELSELSWPTQSRPKKWEGAGFGTQHPPQLNYSFRNHPNYLNAIIPNNPSKLLFGPAVKNN